MELKIFSLFKPINESLIIPADKSREELGFKAEYEDYISRLIVEITEDFEDIPAGTKGWLGTNWSIMDYDYHKHVAVCSAQIPYNVLSVCEREDNGEIRLTPYFQWMESKGIVLVCSGCQKNIAEHLNEECEADRLRWERVMLQQQKSKARREAREKYGRENPNVTVVIQDEVSKNSYYIGLGDLKRLKEAAAEFSGEYDKFFVVKDHDDIYRLFAREKKPDVPWAEEDLIPTIFS